MFLLLGVAPQSVGKSLLTLALCVTLFLLLNIFLLRKSIFRRRYAAESKK